MQAALPAPAGGRPRPRQRPPAPGAVGIYPVPPCAGVGFTRTGSGVATVGGAGKHRGMLPNLETLPQPEPQPEPQSVPPVVAPASPGAGPRVVLRTVGLRKAFGRTMALDGLNLEVREGEIYGFLGRNGAGKTTTIRALMGILQPDAGEVVLLGRAMARVDTETKRHIGYVSQEPHFYPWMTGTQLGRFVGGFYPTWDHAEFRRLMGALQLPLDRRFSHLSGGMQMKLALALALAHRPALLILDEPTAGLDPVARREFLDILAGQARQRGRTTLFSSHLIEEVDRVADRIGIIEAGRMRYEGSLAELKATVRRVREGRGRAENGVPMVDGAAVAPVGVGEGAVASAVSGDALALDVPPVLGAPLSMPPAPAPAPAPAPGPPISVPPRLAMAVPSGFELLRDESTATETVLVLRAPAERWAAMDFGAAVVVEALSLEDVFLSFVAGRRIEL